MRRSMLATRGRAAVALRLPLGVRAQRPPGVRWGAAGRAAVVVSLLGLAVAWPRLSPSGPPLPGARAVPVVAAGRDEGGARASRGAERDGAEGERRGRGEARRSARRRAEGEG